MHIGEVTDDGMLRVKNRGEVVAEIPNRALTDEAPVYRPADGDAGVSRRGAAARRSTRLRRMPTPATDALLTLLASPTIASKRWVYRQYDHMVRTNTRQPAWVGAGVVRIKGTDRALAMSVDGNGRYCYLDP